MRDESVVLFNGQSTVVVGVGTINQEPLRTIIVSERRRKRGKKAR